MCQPARFRAAPTDQMLQHHFGCTPCGPPGLPGGGMTAVDPVDGAGFSIFGSTSFGRITPLEAPSLSLSVPGCVVNVLFGLGETVSAPGSFADAACDGAIAITA